MKVLIADFDLFKKIGGGQTFYRRLIETNPQIEFYYLIELEAPDAPRPVNAKVIPYQETYFFSDIEGFNDLTPPKWIHRSFVMASNIAASISGQRFDVIDLPDYDQLGALLRPALKQHQVSVDRLVLSMHGNISTTLRLNWGNQNPANIGLDRLEAMQYRTVDLRYGISKAYLEEWREIVDLDSHYLNPLHFFPLPKPALTEPTSQLPNLNFIGRTEKRKGPDLFVDLVWWLPRSLYDTAQIIGPESYGEDGTSSRTHLQQMCDRRNVEVQLLPAMEREELNQVFASPSITFLPSRYDTLNLLALESLFSGCPTAIGSGAGVCRFLKETFPNIPFITIDVQEIYACLPKISFVLENYDEYRQNLFEILSSTNTRLEISEPKIEEIYHSHPKVDREVTAQLDRWYQELMRVFELGQQRKNRPLPQTKRLVKSQLRGLKKAVKAQIVKRRELGGTFHRNSVPEVENSLIENTVLQENQAPSEAETSKPELISQIPPLNLKSALKSKLKTTAKQLLPNINRDELRLMAQAVKFPWLIQKYKNAFNTAETTEENLASKLKQYWLLGAIYDPEKALLLSDRDRAEQVHGTGKSVSERLNRRFGTSFRIDRVRLWREIARIEQMRGNDLVAATYWIRGMRLLGGDRFDDLSRVVKILHAHGFSREAAAAEAMYGSIAEREQRCTELLDKALLNNIYNPPREYEFVDDRRNASQYRVSVIVSLYNAAAKLPLFLKALSQQTLIQAGTAEVILIDSGSPGDEYRAFKQLASELDFEIVYARSQQRETIQSAWNRGIRMARSPYLCFLGADETILPDCLEVLAAELDQDPELDWVIGNSLVTNVDRHGTWVSDIMPYDRSGYSQNLVYLETCYLSWVGALYRRSIHDRFGYYDANFRAAGDTEFKNRVLPFIKTKVIPRTLGLFWNYPEERTTQHPRAELEDLRAWYLHRSAAGVRYAFQSRRPEEAESLFFSSLRYRKSYCQHWSTDIEYADQVAEFLRKTVPNSAARPFYAGVRQLLAAYRSLDYLSPLSLSNAIATVLRVRQITTQLEQEHGELNPTQTEPPMYRVFNDNRHEQHAWLWLTEI
jgi:glycosyltransferase involved in cell wall biosynthesis